jgi:hypothetical protein
MRVLVHFQEVGHHYPFFFLLGTYFLFGSEDDGHKTCPMHPIAARVDRMLSRAGIDLWTLITD